MPVTIPESALPRIGLISTHGYVAAEPPLGAADTGGQVVYVIELAKKLAAPFPGTWDRTYVASKVKTDPLYGAVFSELSSSNLSF